MIYYSMCGALTVWVMWGYKVRQGFRGLGACGGKMTSHFPSILAGCPTGHLRKQGGGCIIRSGFWSLMWLQDHHVTIYLLNAALRNGLLSWCVFMHLQIHSLCFSVIHWVGVRGRKDAWVCVRASLCSTPGFKCKCHQDVIVCSCILQVVTMQCYICFSVIWSVSGIFFFSCPCGKARPGFKTKCHVVFSVSRVRIIVFMRMGRLCGCWQTESPHCVEQTSNARASLVPLFLSISLTSSLHLGVLVSFYL